jgi:enoyl-CoA hydratase/carnithine racemase
MKRSIEEVNLDSPYKFSYSITKHLPASIHNAVADPPLAVKQNYWENPEILSQPTGDGTTEACVVNVMLNRHQYQNALDADFIYILRSLLQKYEHNTMQHTILLRGQSEEYFCAGLDLLALYRAKQLGNVALAELNIKAQQELISAMHALHTPVVVPVTGVAAGLGAALSAPHSAQIVLATEAAVWCVPATQLGHVPDAGLTHTLARLGTLGMYLALTGKRVESSDMMHLGLAQGYVASGMVESLERELGGLKSSELTDVWRAIGMVDQEEEPYKLGEYREVIERCFNKDSVAEILDALKAEDSEWSERVLARLNKASPVALLATHRALRAAQQMTLHQCLNMEFTLTQRLMRTKDYWEGIEAHVVENREPVWSYASIDTVPAEVIDALFSENKVPPVHTSRDVAAMLHPYNNATIDPKSSASAGLRFQSVTSSVALEQLLQDTAQEVDLSALPAAYWSLELVPPPIRPRPDQLRAQDDLHASSELSEVEKYLTNVNPEKHDRSATPEQMREELKKELEFRPHMLASFDTFEYSLRELLSSQAFRERPAMFRPVAPPKGFSPGLSTVPVLTNFVVKEDDVQLPCLLRKQNPFINLEEVPDKPRAAKSEEESSETPAEGEEKKE